MNKNMETIKKNLLGRKQGVIGEKTSSKFSVVIPLIQKDGELHILFEVRSPYLNSQPGEICFPGGRVDPEDPSEQYAAVRELCEEVGLEEKDVEIIAPLDRFVPPFNRIIYPYVGLIGESANLSANEAEVAELFTVPLHFFQKNEPEKHEVFLQVKPGDSFPYHLIPGGENYSWRVGSIPEYFYIYESYVIWGLTARILMHFLEEASLLVD
ncbi:NUDIX hydrolase [Thalassorhabdus alkalitolerans]|uniref:NUDIX hydrolase n=1 Tax=Thalassorhabdus alkalitolerans TaxID=2282697 RepID=A0ABW0YM27_9BACI